MPCCPNATTKGPISRRGTVPARIPAKANRQSVELLTSGMNVWPKRLCCVFAPKPHKFSPSNPFHDADISSDLLRIIFFL